MQMKGNMHLQCQCSQHKIELSIISLIMVWFSIHLNFKLIVFELAMHFKHEMIRMLQRFSKNFELSGTSN